MPSRNRRSRIDSATNPHCAKTAGGGIGDPAFAVLGDLVFEWPPTREGLRRVRRKIRAPSQMRQLLLATDPSENVGGGRGNCVMPSAQ